MAKASDGLLSMHGCLRLASSANECRMLSAGLGIHAWQAGMALAFQLFSSLDRHHARSLRLQIMAQEFSGITGNVGTLAWVRLGAVLRA